MFVVLKVDNWEFRLTSQHLAGNVKYVFVFWFFKTNAKKNDFIGGVWMYC